MNTLKESYPDTHHDVYSKTVFGFWLYLLTDFVLFGVLFAVYIVLKNSTFGGPSAQDLFNLPMAFSQTLILLTSSYLIGLGGAFAHRQDRKKTIVFFCLAALLGIAFMVIVQKEFSDLIIAGNDMAQSAFLSAFFTLIGTFSLHMLFALLWVIVLIVPVCYKGINAVCIKRLTCLRMFWQFLNIVWIFIFSIVYLLR